MEHSPLLRPSVLARSEGRLRSRTPQRRKPFDGTDETRNRLSRWPPDGQLNAGVVQRVSVEWRVRAAEWARQTPCRAEPDRAAGVTGSVKQVAT